MTGQNSTQQSFSSRNHRASENSKVPELDSDTKGRFVGFMGLAAFSVWIIVSVSTHLYFSVVSAHWPKATARVISSGVYANRASVARSFSPAVEYEYEVGGATRRSSNIRYLMHTFYDVGSATEVQLPYPAGRVVSAAYDPQNPNRSVLEPGIPPGMWTQGLIPLFFCGLCGYMFFEITHPQRRLLLQSNPADPDYEEDGKGGDEAEMA